jgi:hypothetical protein
MKTEIKIEFRIKSLLQEVDWNDKYSDVRKVVLDTKSLVDDLNAEIERKYHNQQIGISGSGLKEKDRIKRPIDKPMWGTGLKNFTTNNEIDLEKFMRVITKRPNEIFNTNDKTERTTANGTEVTLKTGIPPLWGIVYDEDEGKFTYINTCPGAGSCMATCYAMKGNYMYDHSVAFATQKLNFLINDPQGYEDAIFAQLKEIVSELKMSGTKLVLRWNDSGDFFSKTYFEIARNVTKKLIKMGYDVKGYAYTKMGELIKMYGEDGDMKLTFSTNAEKSQLVHIDLSKVNFSQMVPRRVSLRDIFDRTSLDTGKKTAHIQIDPKSGKVIWENEQSKDELRKRIYELYKDELGIKQGKLIFEDELPEEYGKDREYYVIMVKNDSDIAAQRPDVRGVFILEH